MSRRRPVDVILKTILDIPLYVFDTNSGVKLMFG